MKIIFFSLFSLCLLHLKAQKRNVIYAEILGNGLGASINYDFAPLSQYDHFRLRFGLGGPINPIIIAQANYLFGKEKHFLEIGVGTASTEYSIGPNRIPTPILSLNAAVQYRYESSKGFFFRIGYAPTFVKGGGLDQLLWVWPGLSLGYAF